jgi:hypothetical protein
MGSMLSDIWKACGTYTAPPPATRSAHSTCAAASRPVSTAGSSGVAPRTNHDASRDHHRVEHVRSNDPITRQIVVTRCRHGGHMFAAWQWPRHTRCSSRVIIEQGIEHTRMEQTGGLCRDKRTATPTWPTCGRGSPPANLPKRLPAFGLPLPRTHLHDGQGSTACKVGWTHIRLS